jgi:hypothetical protein
VARLIADELITLHAPVTPKPTFHVWNASFQADLAGVSHGFLPPWSLGPGNHPVALALGYRDRRWRDFAGYV